MKTRCRCGWNGEGEHPCHRCHDTEGSPRFMPYPVCLAGAQLKMGAYETWACDKCWEEFKEEIKTKD